MSPGVATDAGRREGRVADTIMLTIPADERFRSVPTLVLGGVGTRLDLPFERMDDLQLAVLSTLDAVEGDEASVEVAIADDRVSVFVGPLGSPGSDRDGLSRVLSRLVDEHGATTRDGVEWMTMRLSRAPRAE